MFCSAKILKNLFNEVWLLKENKIHCQQQVFVINWNKLDSVFRDKWPHFHWSLKYRQIKKNQWLTPRVLALSVCKCLQQAQVKITEVFQAGYVTEFPLSFGGHFVDCQTGVAYIFKNWSQCLLSACQPKSEATPALVLLHLDSGALLWV